ncbi:MAG: hypothetical protein AMXMBFR61_27080 [Fimbriimonadales bacterium]
MPDLETTIAAHVRRIAPLAPESSIGSAAEFLRMAATPFVVVCEGSRPVGVIGETELSAAVAAGCSPEEPVRHHVSSDLPTLAPDAKPETAAKAIHEAGRGAAAVVGQDGRYLGIVTAGDLIARSPLPLLPTFIGGMATPFGVYLTTGFVSAGRGSWALVATGALLFTLFLAANALAAGVAWLADSFLGLGLVQMFLSSTVPDPPVWSTLATHSLTALAFLMLLRTIPLSAIHGAEHKVVHAIERQEQLSLEVVRRMPRVHARCGTNLAAGAVLFLSLAGVAYSPEWQPVGMLGALLATVALWRPLGQGLQRFATTREPSDRQIEQAIEAGKELLAKARRAGDPRASFPTRLVNSGVLQILLGALLCATAVDLLERLLGFTLPVLG